MPKPSHDPHTPISRAHVSQGAYAKLDRTIAYMEQEYRSVITREQLAELAGLNPAHYSRIFRKYKGNSPMDYLARLRMDQAKTLLLQTDLPITEIGQRVGYTDPYHFSRRFKQVIGVSPAGYAKEYQPRVIALDGLGHCLALGVKPLAADIAHAGGFVDLDGTDIQDIGNSLRPRVDLGALAALQPATVLTANSELAQQLEGEVVRIDVYQDPIYEQLPMVAQALGRSVEAKAWTAQYEAECAYVRTRLFGAVGGGRVAILRVREELMQMYGMLNMGYPLYHSLQLAPPDKIAMQCLCNTHFHSSVITVDELPFYEAEHLFVVIQPDAGARTRWQAMIESERWQSFPAVRMGKVYPVDVHNWLPNDPLSIVRQMQEAAAWLTGERTRHNYPSWMQ
ncbi:helix-turn-helix domain-containing protein [Paenibacillus daejeonensis]|uniref:helix-turn-helix domain-containing protein n=1 Tax=Paenibacillus daejeonensis TaxID=135193 RepID=UPI00036261B3|nr:helix-turn-helix domain-containing protein [Paenibacillus daejeonensis]